MFGEVSVGEVVYKNIEDVKKDFLEGKIDPKTLKTAVIEGFKKFYLENEEVAKIAQELLKKKWGSYYNKESHFIFTSQ